MSEANHHTKPYLLIFDHGTTGLKACLMNRQGKIVARGYQPIEQFYPQPGWVEQDAASLWKLTLDATKKAFFTIQVGWKDIAAIGLTNQRETVILWDAETGEPLHNAIVWQCRRTADYCNTLRQAGHAEMIRQKTGLVVDPYFSASKIRWMLDNVPGAKELATQGRLKFGTVDTWILWKLSGGKLHLTDPTNASRTQLFNIHTRQWDADLLTLFGVPGSILPQVALSNAVYGATDKGVTDGAEIPLAGVVGDQQAALHGQKCWAPGMAKSTYGTGAFLVMNTGDDSVQSRQGLLTTLATDGAGNPAFALEGAIFIAGATIEWLQKKLEILQNPAEMDALVATLPDNEGVYLVPALAGLGAPYWDADARGAIFGLTQDSGRAHLVRAALEAMAYQTRQVLDIMREEAGLKLEILKVDGGVTRSDFLMQFLADILGRPVLRSDDAELTAKGAGYLAGLAVGFWKNADEIAQLPEKTERFDPKMPEATREALYQAWVSMAEKVLTTR